jgi:ATP-dependent protease HslVU (ClpYQ) peptidase subunit
LTAIVGVEHGGRVTLGGDSAATDLEGSGQWISRGPKVCRRGGLVFGAAGTWRVYDLIRHQLDPPVQMDPPERFVHKELVPALRVLFRDHDSTMSGADLLIGVGGRLFVLDEDWQIDSPNMGYCAIGDGAQVALGSMHALSGSGLTPIQRITESLEAAGLFCCSVRPPWTFVSA